MDEQSQSEPNGESVTDIQNYLASFNKEIQDGSASSTATTEATEGRTYYVTQASETYQFADQNQAQYEGTTYHYTPTENTFYSTAQLEDGTGQYQEISTYPGREVDGAKVVAGQTAEIANFQGTVVSEDGVLNQAGSADKHAGLQQIVLAVSEAASAPAEVVEVEPREISVTIPASMAGVVHESTERLLHAVGSQRDAGEASDAPEQPTFVAMQPGSSHDGDEEITQVVTVRGTRSLASLISQGEDIVQATTSQHQTIRMVVRQPDGTETEQTIPVSGSNGSTLLTSDGQEIHVSDESTLQMMASLAEQAAAGEDGNNQVILNTGNSYQTVTIVPSDTNPGEVSYVLIVSQPDDKDDKGVNLDMSVYDFNEGEKHSELVSEETAPDGTKMRTIKITPKKSQIVTQAHMCNYCNYTSPKRYLLSRHMKSHSEERPHKCSVCERGFKTLASLQNHVNTHTGTRPHQCKECEAAFTTSGELVRHVRYKHTHEKPHRCTECDYASVELSKLKRHMRCHTGERPYQCPHCTYASPDTYKLKRHLRIHTGEKPYECDVCHARFTQSNSLKAHKLIHSGNKPVFQCDLCPTTCGRKTDLRIHVQKLHTSDKPLKCKRCGKSFPDRYTYKVHVKTHEGEKCFKCDLCPYASISQRHLESHMLIHTDQKPYQCDECNQSFRQKQLLKRHRNLYHDPNYIPPIPKEKTHECPECSKAFRHKGNLIRHLAVHDPDATQAEKEEAMRIGLPKGPGEEHDGEEDDEEYLDEEDEDEEDEDDLERQMNMAERAANDGQQVVVFEVIQLPSEGSDQNLAENAAAVAMATANGETPEGVTIIQQVGDLSEDVAAAMAQVHGAGLTELPRTLADDYSTVTVVNAPPTPRRRGRPRKYPLPEPINLPISLNRGGEPVVVEVAHGHETRNLRRRRHTETQDDTEEEIITASPVKRGRPRLKQERDEEPVDPAELARREEELNRKRLEQKQKDMQECFGFNDDEEEDETILAMSSVPGVIHNVNINGPGGIVNGSEEAQIFS